MATQYSKNKLLDSNYVDGDWFLIFRQDSSSGDFFSSNNDWAEAKQTNIHTPSATKYSNLYLLEKFRRYDKLTMMLKWPNLNASTNNIWSQTNNPVTDDGSGGVTDYTAIDIDYTSNIWGGLERYNAQSSTFIDGSVNHPNWYYAIGSKSWGSATTFPGPSSAVNLVELWVKFKNI